MNRDTLIGETVSAVSTTAATISVKAASLLERLGIAPAEPGMGLHLDAAVLEEYKVY